MNTASADRQLPLGLFPGQPKPRLYDRVVQGLDDGYDIRTVQELLGHKDVKTTMVYTHVLNHGGQGVRSPLDNLRQAVSSESGRIIRASRSA